MINKYHLSYMDIRRLDNQKAFRLFARQAFKYTVITILGVLAGLAYCWLSVRIGNHFNLLDDAGRLIV